MNIKFILSRLSVCAIALALAVNTANAKVLDRKVRAVTEIPEKIEIKEFTKDDIVEPVQPAFEEIVKAAGNGNADMHLQLGWRYFNGAEQWCFVSCVMGKLRRGSRRRGDISLSR